MTRINKCPRRQSGAALLLMMLVIMIAATALLVSRLNGNAMRARQTEETGLELARAKQALIDYAATFADLANGAALALPCPDLDASGTTLNGESHTDGCAATGVSIVGRLPWRTLGIAPLVDHTGECFWYAVSGSYKNAGSGTDAMINPDSNGQLQLFATGSGVIVEGANPEDRPVAIVFAPNSALPGQVRAASGTGACSDDFAAASYLDIDAATGISNAALSGSGYVLERFAVSTVASDLHNDRVITIRRSELAEAIYRRPDFLPAMQSLTRAIAGCVAAWGKANPGATDFRLPWPASVSMTDYRDSSQYDDSPGPALSGRLPNRVDDSSSATSNSTTELLGGCDPALVSDWSPGQWQLWQNWKDHFFYAVAEAYGPAAVMPISCGNCLSVNGTGTFAAIVFFAGARLRLPGQTRNAPPLDADTKSQIGNYLEGRNSSNHPYSSGSANFETRAPDESFNDIAWCIDGSLNVVTC